MFLLGSEKLTNDLKITEPLQLVAIHQVLEEDPLCLNKLQNLEIDLNEMSEKILGQDDEEKLIAEEIADIPRVSLQYYISNAILRFA